MAVPTFACRLGTVTSVTVEWPVRRGNGVARPGFLKALQAVEELADALRLTNSERGAMLNENINRPRSTFGLGKHGPRPPW